MRIYQNIGELVGKTPLLNLQGYGARLGLSSRLLAKLEYYNPAGSAKDRVAKQMLEEAEKRGDLCPDSVILEPTSGNTGIGLAAMASRKGYRVILTMPETMSVERRKLLQAYGAELVLTPGQEGMTGAIRKAQELAKEFPHSFLPGQFENPDNPAAHLLSTGPEIWEDTDGQVDCFVAGVGTGGTLSGTGEYLRKKNSHIRIVAVEPADSPLLSQGKAGPHGIQGIGAGFVPATLNQGIIDEVVTVHTEQAYEAARLLAKTEGILVGISSGAALWAATELAKRPAYVDKTLVVVLPDGGDRYLSTPLFDA